MSLWKGFLLDANDFGQVGNDEGSDPFLSDRVGDFGLERIENFGDLFLRQAGCFRDVGEDLNFGERLFGLASCFRHVEDPCT